MNIHASLAWEGVHTRYKKLVGANSLFVCVSFCEHCIVIGIRTSNNLLFPLHYIGYPHGLLEAKHSEARLTSHGALHGPMAGIDICYDGPIGPGRIVVARNSRCGFEIAVQLTQQIHGNPNSMAEVWKYVLLQYHIDWIIL